MDARPGGDETGSCSRPSAAAIASKELRRAFGALLTRAQQAGAVREDIDLDQAMAVPAGACLAAEHASWDPDLQAGGLTIVFDGLRPRGSRWVRRCRRGAGIRTGRRRALGT
jgi:hypothetical protein